MEHQEASDNERANVLDDESAASLVEADADENHKQDRSVSSSSRVPNIYSDNTSHNLEKKQTDTGDQSTSRRKKDNDTGRDEIPAKKHHVLKETSTASMSSCMDETGKENESEGIDEKPQETSLRRGQSVVVSETVVQPKGVLMEPESTVTSQESAAVDGESETKPASRERKASRKKHREKTGGSSHKRSARRQNRPMAESLPGAFATGSSEGAETSLRPASSSNLSKKKSSGKKHQAQATDSLSTRNESAHRQNRAMAESLPGAFSVSSTGGTQDETVMTPASSRAISTEKDQVSPSTNRKQRSKRPGVAESLQPPTRRPGNRRERPQAASLPVLHDAETELDGPSIYTSEEMIDPGTDGDRELELDGFSKSSNSLYSKGYSSSRLVSDEILSEDEAMAGSLNANTRSVSMLSHSIGQEGDRILERAASERTAGSRNSSSRRSFLELGSSRDVQQNIVTSQDLVGRADQPNLISATLVQEDDSPIIAATEVVSEEQIRRRRILIGGAVVLLVAGLVTAIVMITTSGGESDGDVGDPRCLVPINEQIVTTQCICQGSISVIPDGSLELAEELLSALQNEGVLPNDFNNTINQTSCTPENQALWWVADPRNVDIPLESISDLRDSGNFPLFISGIIQRFIMVLFYFSMGGDNWDRQDNWLSPLPVCDWFGIKCALSFRVTFLEMPSNGLTGTIPKQVGFLSHLQMFVLGFNPLMTGFLPSELAKMRGLRVLDIRHAGLGGSIPKDFYQLDILNSLILFNNSITGSIPTELATLSLLQNLDLGDNALSSTIPLEIGNMTNLGILNLEHNMMTGPIPTSIVGARNLQMIKVAGNQFSGPIPDEIDALSLLGTLDLKKNLLNGTIPESIANLARLTLLSLSGNQFEGSVPEKICQEADFLDAVIVDCIESEPLGSNCSCCYCEEAVLNGFAGF